MRLYSAAPFALAAFATFNMSDIPTTTMTSHPCPDGMKGTVQIAVRPGETTYSGICRDEKTGAEASLTYRTHDKPPVFSLK